MPQVRMWKTTDGQIFETEKEHDDHESRLQDELIVGKFIASREWANEAQRTKAQNILMEFLDWKNRPVVVDISAEKATA